MAKRAERKTKPASPPMGHVIPQYYKLLTSLLIIMGFIIIITFVKITNDLLLASDQGCVTVHTAGRNKDTWTRT